MEKRVRTCRRQVYQKWHYKSREAVKLDSLKHVPKMWVEPLRSSIASLLRKLGLEISSRQIRTFRIPEEVSHSVWSSPRVYHWCCVAQNILSNRTMHLCFVFRTCVRSATGYEWKVIWLTRMHTRAQVTYKLLFVFCRSYVGVYDDVDDEAEYRLVRSLVDSVASWNLDKLPSCPCWPDSNDADVVNLKLSLFVVKVELDLRYCMSRKRGDGNNFVPGTEPPPWTYVRYTYMCNDNDR